MMNLPSDPMAKDLAKEETVAVSRRELLLGAALTGGAAVLASRASSVQAESPPVGHGGHSGHGSNGYGSMMFMKNHHMPPGTVIEPPGSPSDDEVSYQTFEMDVQIVQHEILPGIKVHMFGFNGQVPGPEFHVTEGDWIKVRFTNKTDEMHTIHWHGLTVPYTMDGVPMVTQDPVHPGHTFVYRFQAKPSGTRWYHCHWGTPLHISLGMHGAFIVHRKEEPLKKRFPYTREYTLILEAFDINFAREEIGGLLEGMKQVNLLMEQGKLDPMTHGFFQNYEEFLKVIKQGKYVPPYVAGRSSGIEIKPSFFCINGKSHPATKSIGIKKDEWIRVRLINASDEFHSIHLHGHDFWHVAQDGNDLDMPRHINTLQTGPGGTYDIMIYGDNPGYWMIHDHREQVLRNNGVYPGGMMTMLEYEDFKPSYQPSLSIDQ